jgi:hypothetical protein
MNYRGCAVGWYLSLEFGEKGVRLIAVYVHLRCGSNVIPRRAGPGLAGLGPHRASKPRFKDLHRVYVIEKKMMRDCRVNRAWGRPNCTVSEIQGAPERGSPCIPASSQRRRVLIELTTSDRKLEAPREGSE